MNTKFKKSKNRLIPKIYATTGKFAILSLIFLVFLFLLSGIEIALVFNHHSLESSFLKLWGWSCFEDLKYWLSLVLPVYLIFLPLHIVSPKIIESAFKVLFILFFIVQLILVFYYNTTLLMLGSDLFGYTLEEITQTVGASGSLSLIPVIIFLIFLSLLVYFFFGFNKRLNSNSSVSFALPLISLIFILSGFSKKITAWNLPSDFENNLVKNKSNHFYGAAYSYFNPEIYEPDIYSESYLGEFLSKYSYAQPINYLDENNYPFLHSELDTDVLSPFFDTREQAPDIVIIIVEGLGRAFTNKGAYLGNFTPFLDSLSSKSLYWPNFLSNGGRTFTVLPSLLGSLPFAKNGFMELKNKMPDHLSLLNLLKENGYATSFYYGGNSEFDNMGLYLRKNKVDRVLDENDFFPGYKKIPASASGFTWGYGDKELYRYYLETKNDTQKPVLDVLLTVSSHSPFLTNEPEKYKKIFEARMEEFGFSEEKKKLYRNYTSQYTSVLFADDALKNLMASYKKRKGFNNTIFIITGDHRIPEIPMASKIDRYHVPMIIYSPLLKRTAEFESVSSHFDLAPSLITFLKNNYAIKTPANNAFIGRGLDTTRNFQNIHNIPLKQTKTDLVDFVMGEYHLNGQELYKLDRKFKEKPVNDQNKKDEILNAFNQFRRKNTEIIEGKKILPDTLFRNFSTR